MLDAVKKKEMMEQIVKDIMQRMKDQGMSEVDILKTIENISKQAKEDEFNDLQKKTTRPKPMYFKRKKYF